LNSSESQKRTAPDEQIDRVLKYATKLLPKVELDSRTLTPKDMGVTYQFGERSLFHVRAYPRKQHDTFNSMRHSLAFSSRRPSMTSDE
jgi:hypothetical protein